MNLIREILLLIEQGEAHIERAEMQLEGYSPEATSYHLGLAREAGLVEQFVNPLRHRAIEGPEGPGGRLVHTSSLRLTWEGHEFLDSVRDNGIWKDVRGRVERVGGGASIAVFKAVAQEVIKSALGLSP